MKQILRASSILKNQLVKLTIQRKTMYCSVRYKERHDTLEFLKSNKTIAKVIPDSTLIYRVEFQIIYPIAINPFTEFPVDGLTRNGDGIFYSFDIQSETNDIFVPILNPKSKFQLFESSKDEIKKIIDEKKETEKEKNNIICRNANKKIDTIYADSLNYL